MRLLLFVSDLLSEYAYVYTQHTLHVLQQVYERMWYCEYCSRRHLGSRRRMYLQLMRERGHYKLSAQRPHGKHGSICSKGCQHLRSGDWKPTRIRKLKGPSNC